MNELEKKLDLGRQGTNFEEEIYEYPSAIILSEIPMTKQTMDMLIYVCSHDGLALQYASKRLIDQELCKVAVKENGRAIQYVPNKIIDRADKEWVLELYEEAVASNGRALEFVPDNYKTNSMVHNAIKYQGELDEWEKYPISFIPKLLLTDEIMVKAVSYNPFCLRDIEKNKITKELASLAISINPMAMKHIPKSCVTKDTAILAVAKEPLSIQYISKKFITQDLCTKCVKANYKTFIYIPEKYITEDMCIELVESDRVSLNSWGTIRFMDFPETLRNNNKILDAIVKRSQYGALQLIRWSESVKESEVSDSNGKLVAPLKKETVEYLLPKVIKVEETLQSDEQMSSEISFIPISCVNIKDNPIENFTLLTPSNDEGKIILKSDNNPVVHELSEETVSQTVYYVTDIHLEHHMAGDEKLCKELNRAKTSDEKYEIAGNWIDKKVSELVSEANNKDMLLIGGDIASGFELRKKFFTVLKRKWEGIIISVLGNHELWDGTTPKEWCNPNFVPRAVEDIVDNYKEMHDRYGNILLENELFIYFKNREKCIVSEKDILDASESSLTELLSKCSVIILGGIGYSGLNKEYNAESGLYRKTVSTIEEDIRRSEKFRDVYDKVLRCSCDKKVIVLTHTQIEDWTTDEPNKNCIYVNGHTHQNIIRRTEDGGIVFSDNQIGYGYRKKRNSTSRNIQMKYTYPKWRLNSFVIDRLWYDPFENKPDGVYTINSESYLEFNRGRGIKCEGCSYNGTLYMLKRSNMYMFLLESPRSLCLLAGGKRHKMNNHDVHYYYESMDIYSEKIRRIIEPYQKVMHELSKEIKVLGGTGAIHGCIVDIDFFNHIYVNPFDGKMTSYFAYDICSRQLFGSIKNHLESTRPDLLPRYLQECKNKSLSLLNESLKSKSELAYLPRWMMGTEIYDPSRIMRAVQYVWEQNVIRIWNEDVLHEMSFERLEE